MSSKATALLLAALLLGSSCSTIRPVLEGPEGFAAYDRRSDYRAVSPEGVLLRVRLVENEPVQTLAFWVEALKTHLAAAGYTLLVEEALPEAARPTTILEWVAPVGEEDWIYLTALTVRGDRIAIGEAAGERGLYGKYRHAILASLSGLEIGR